MSGRAGAAGTPRGLVGPKARKTVSLALQGGGAHGAFTWGVLDRLIEDGRFAFEAVTGASSGAINAVVMADGWLEGGPDGARRHLETFWQYVSLDGGLSLRQRQAFDMLCDMWSPSLSNPLLELWRSTLQAPANPLDINPLREVLNSLVDFERLRGGEVGLFVSATNVRTGKIRIFERHELRAEHVTASSCLPTVFHAVEIGGEAYWDGGYTGNPALFPLFYTTRTDDILIVQIDPVERPEVPTGMVEVQNRLAEITFGGGLLSELRAIDFVNRLIDQGKLSREEYKRALVHRVDGGERIARYVAATRLQAEWDFFRRLRDIGRESADAWLAAHYDEVGQRSTLDLRAAYS
ncbi:patatin-like phospholipase family protein [Enterovirga sp.]|uniref:patatin-like phospholipase family protein n=1 Tax=Enterovirga sp. TaxID=2026350 RepID=UPI002B61A5FD|nr:patatin-like phospholipase family protein [Enterovirga sp.]HMO30358.1 patatin-like phospholipase family protein [Enterovirga sp.]